MAYKGHFPPKTATGYTAWQKMGWRLGASQYPARDTSSMLTHVWAPNASVTRPTYCRCSSCSIVAGHRSQTSIYHLGSKTLKGTGNAGDGSPKFVRSQDIQTPDVRPADRPLTSSSPVKPPATNHLAVHSAHRQPMWEATMVTEAYNCIHTNRAYALN